MSRTYNWSACILPALFFAGCQTNFGSNPIPVKAAIDNVEENLRTAEPLVTTDLISSDPNTVQRGQKKIIEAQCFYASKNPVIGVLTKEFTLQLQGSFTATGTGTGTIIPIPGAGVGFSVAVGKTQSISIPITFVTLENVPNVYFSTNAAYYASAPDGKAGDKIYNSSKDEKKRMLEALWANRNRIDQLIKYMIANPPANLDTCKSNPPPPVQPTIQ